MGGARGTERHPTIRGALLLGLGPRLDRRAALRRANGDWAGVDANRCQGWQKATVTDRRGDFPDALEEAMGQLRGVVVARQRARPGSREHNTLLADEEQLISRVTTLLRLRDAALGRPPDLA